MSKILVVLTSHTAMGDTGRLTGFFYEELATPYWAFIDAGFDVDIASIQGGAAAYDPSSLDADATARPAPVRRFLADPTAMSKLAKTSPIEAVNEATYNAVFLPGGHGTMWDFPGSGALARIVGTFFDAGKVVGAVCHGPAGLLSARRADGRPIVAGRRVNGFTDAEEQAVGLTHVVPFLLETRLREQGGLFENGPNFQPYAVRDGNLVTGQNPASSALVAESIIAALRDGGVGAAA
jgi:putative intracellular protease/amidase